jgi:trimethylamine---corrinoid protein Co-methyltransferase
VRFEPAMIEELMSSAPSQFTFHARNPENNFRSSAGRT